MLFETREAILFRRAGRPVAFAFVTESGIGPIAALDPADQAAILLAVGAWAADRGQTEIEFEIPMINEVAMRHLLRRGFRISPPFSLFISIMLFGPFDRDLLCLTPMVF